MRFRKACLHFRQANAALAAVLAVGLALGGIGKGLPYNGLSPLARSIQTYEHGIASEIAREKHKARLLYEGGVKQRIASIIDDYRTGLKFEGQDQVAQVIFDESEKYGFDPMFLTAVIVTESSFYNWAKSHRGALGLMQIRPATARALVDEVETVSSDNISLYNPEQNIALGAFYLNKLIDRFGDLKLALEAYNHGPSRLVRILKKGKRPHRYSGKVMKLYKAFRERSI